MAGLCYNEKVTPYKISTQHMLDKNCNGYLAINNGDTLVMVNNKPLKPPIAPNLSGESAGVVGWAGEIFQGNNGALPIVFVNPGGAGVNQSVLIIEKYYL